MKEPAARRLAAAAAAPRRKRRPPALARGRKRRRRASARRPLVPAGTAAAQTTGTPSEADGKRCWVGLRVGRRAGTAPEAARETGRTGRPHEPESLRGPFRDAPHSARLRQQAGSVRQQPRSASRQRSCPPADRHR